MNRRFKDEVYGHLARLGKATSAPKRLELLDLLCQGPKTVEALAREAAISVANASQHLKVLRAARLVEAEKRGLYVEYRPASEAVCDFFLSFRQLGEQRLAEVEQVRRDFHHARGTLEPVPSRELLERARRGEVTVLDVRPADEYRAGHVRGALSVPVAELEARVKALPRGREVVAYCRGPLCVMAAEAVERLRAKGFKAHRLDLGVAELRARGFRVATGEEVAS